MRPADHARPIPTWRAARQSYLSARERRRAELACAERGPRPVAGESGDCGSMTSFEPDAWHRSPKTSRPAAVGRCLAGPFVAARRSRRRRVLRSDASPVPAFYRASCATREMSGTAPSLRHNSFSWCHEVPLLGLPVEDVHRRRCRDHPGGPVLHWPRLQRHGANLRRETPPWRPPIGMVLSMLIQWGPHSLQLCDCSGPSGFVVCQFRQGPMKTGSSTGA